METARYPKLHLEKLIRKSLDVIQAAAKTTKAAVEFSRLIYNIHESRERRRRPLMVIVQLIRVEGFV